MRRLNRLRLSFLLLFSNMAAHSFSQNENIQERIVENRKVFICTWSDRDTFKTAEEGCKHWAEKHLPAGYKSVSATVTENGAVRCLCKKTGSGDNEQQGQIMGIILCPEYASSYSKNNDNNYKELACLCYEGYKAKGSVCEKDTCAEYAKMGEDGLKEWARIVEPK